MLFRKHFKVIQITEPVIRSVSPFHYSPNVSASSHSLGAAPQERRPLPLPAFFLTAFSSRCRPGAPRPASALAAAARAAAPTDAAERGDPTGFPAEQPCSDGRVTPRWAVQARGHSLGAHAHTAAFPLVQESCGKGGNGFSSLARGLCCQQWANETNSSKAT